MAPPTRQPRLVVYSRAGCGLCGAMVSRLREHLAPRGLAFEVLDVDAEAAARQRYGLKVPVLVVDGEPVCSGRLDEEALQEALQDALPE